jgi:hypothetical protein
MYQRKILNDREGTQNALICDLFPNPGKMHGRMRHTTCSDDDGAGRNRRSCPAVVRRVPHSHITMRVILFFACLLILGSAQLNCPQLPPHTPTSIHDLAPNVRISIIKYLRLTRDLKTLQDIQVVMALGDSVTAGNTPF